MASLRVLERRAPGLGARVVERFWFTVPRRRPPAVEVPPGATEFTLDVAGRRVRGRRWGHEDDVVYLVHGWGGRSTQLGAFVQPLRAAGYSVVAHDALSHGDSDAGPMGAGRSNVLEHVAALRAVVAAHGPAYGVVAHSLGAMAAAVAMREGVVPRRAVYVAPMADAASYTLGFTRMLGAGYRTWERFIARLEHRFDRPLSWFDMTAAAREASTPPLLVVHDREDRETRWAASEAVVRDWPGARLVTTQGLGHNRLLADPLVVTEAVGFLAGAGRAAEGIRPGAEVAA
ncbi:MAG TPA: alpha/beta hydrolase [Jiangellales bacterium]|nr:alpha/beta hydrolase [Jiangellales bacterium]